MGWIRPSMQMGHPLLPSVLPETISRHRGGGQFGSKPAVLPALKMVLRFVRLRLFDEGKLKS